ncbi:MAG: tetratricopeptide repeat protein [Candidatus Thorarchaeota archaeon]
MNENHEELTHLSAFYKGRDLEAKGELDEALRYYRIAIDKEPTFIKGLFQMAKVYYRMGNQLEAMDLALKIIELEPKWTEQVRPFLGEESTIPKEKFENEGVFEVFRKEGSELKSVRSSARQKQKPTQKLKQKLRPSYRLTNEDREILAHEACSWEDAARQGLIFFMQGKTTKASYAFKQAYDQHPANIAVLSFLLICYIDDLPDNPFPFPLFQRKIISPKDSKLITQWKDSMLILMHILKPRMETDLSNHLAWIPKNHLYIGGVGTALVAAYPIHPSKTLVDLARHISSDCLGIRESKSDLIHKNARIFEQDGMPREDAIRKVKECIVDVVGRTGALGDFYHM